jgi:hypothetical protein
MCTKAHGVTLVLSQELPGNATNYLELLKNWHPCISDCTSLYSLGARDFGPILGHAQVPPPRQTEVGPLINYS